MQVLIKTAQPWARSPALSLKLCSEATITAACELGRDVLHLPKF